MCRVILISMFLLFNAGESVAVNDDLCEQLVIVQQDVSKKLPLKVDEVTKLVELVVNCETRVMKYVKHLSIRSRDLADGFAEQKHRQYVNVHCNQHGLARSGWTVTDYLYDVEMKLVAKLSVGPSDCAKAP